MEKKSNIKNLIDTKEWRHGLISFFKNDKVVGSSIQEYGEWAQKEIDLLGELITPNDTIIDIGGFIGTHTIAFSKLVTEGLVHVFEPNPLSFEVLSLNILNNNINNVVLHNDALSNCETTYRVDFDLLVSDNPGSFTLIDMDCQTNYEPIKNFKILGKKLDNYNLFSCDLLKIDAEGMEIKILEGSRRIIETFSPIVYAECLSVENGVSLMNFMNKYHYSCFLHSYLAYSQNNHFSNPVNIFGKARELNLLFVPENKEEIFFTKNQYFQLPRIKNIDDLVLGCLKKPQYKYEVLAKSTLAETIGCDFWLNEEEKDNLISTHSSQLQEKDNLISTYASQLQEKDNLISTYASQLQEKNEIISNFQEEILLRTKTIQTILTKMAWKENEIQKRDLEYKQLSDTLNSTSQELSIFSSQLWEIKNSRSWKVITYLWKIRLSIFPSNSTQTRFVKYLLANIRFIRNAGLIPFLKQFPSITRNKKTLSRKDYQIKAKTNRQPSFVYPNPVYECEYGDDSDEQIISDHNNKFDQFEKTDLIEIAIEIMLSKTIIISISHDSYLSVDFGGIQMFIFDEREYFNKNNVSYLHFFPISKIDHFIDNGQMKIGMNIDDMEMGIHDPEYIIQFLEELKLRQYDVLSFNIHQFKGWTFSVLSKLIKFSKSKYLNFYIHDFYSVCPQYTLLRNEKKYCYAPDPSSNSCTICSFGKKREKHLPLVNHFFSSFPIKIISPSKSALKIWNRTFPNINNERIVEPHFYIRERPRMDLIKKKFPINIAFAGQPVHQKGWEFWRLLVETQKSSNGLKFFHLGMNGGGHHEIFENVKVTSKDRNAMKNALIKNEIDVLFYWPTAPETYSFVLHEAIIAGCFILTSNESGNIADYVTKNKNGIVFTSFDNFLKYIQDLDNLKKDIETFHKETPFSFELIPNRTISDVILKEKISE